VLGLIGVGDLLDLRGVFGQHEHIQDVLLGGRSVRRDEPSDGCDKRARPMFHLLLPLSKTACSANRRLRSTPHVSS
jgi:hypothetical protein